MKRFLRLLPFGIILFFIFLSNDIYVFAERLDIEDVILGGDCHKIGTWDNLTKTCTLTKDTPIGDYLRIDNNGITLDGNGHWIVGDGTKSGVYVPDKRDITIINLNFSQVKYGIFLNNSSNNLIANNTAIWNSHHGLYIQESHNNKIENNLLGYSLEHGIRMDDSHNNIISNNIIKKINDGIRLDDSNDNIITENTVLDARVTGIDLHSSSRNLIYHNDILTPEELSIWDDCQRCENKYNENTGGNHYSDYDEEFEGCQDKNLDGFCDYPFLFEDGMDEYPLTQNATSHYSQIPRLDELSLQKIPALPDGNSPSKKESVPDWIKNIVWWYYEEDINSKDFSRAIEYLVKIQVLKLDSDEVMVLPIINEDIKIKMTWWVLGFVDDSEFIKIINYLFTIRSETINSNLEVRTPILRDPNLYQEVVYSGKGFLSSMKFLDSNDIIVTDTYSGQLKRIKNGLMLNQPLLDIDVAQGDERGLLSVESINDYQGKFLIFVYVTESGDNGKAQGNRLYSFEFMDDRLQNKKLLLDLPAWPGTSHNGGAMAIDKEKNLYLVVGDLNPKNVTEGNTLTQNLMGGIPDGRGGILRITPDGEMVDNGILSDEGILGKYFAYGIRNSFGLGFDPLTGFLWDTENGPHYGDEINLVEPGFNSGWRKVMGFSNKYENFDPTTLIDFNGAGKYSEPEFEWQIPVAPTAITFLSSSNLGEKYEGNMFVGAVGYGGTIYNFDLDPSRQELLLGNELSDKISNSLDELKENEFATNAGIVTDIEVGPDGFLYVLSNFDSQSILVKILSKNL